MSKNNATLDGHPILALELYVDLISRVIPGALLIVGLWICIPSIPATVHGILHGTDPGVSIPLSDMAVPTVGSGLTRMSWGVAVCLLILILVLCYAVGMFLTWAGFLLSCLHYVFVWRHAVDRHTTLMNRYNQWRRENELKEIQAAGEAASDDNGRDGAKRRLRDVLKKVPKLLWASFGRWRVDRRHYSRFDGELHEQLKQSDTQAAIILPKMRAEGALCANLAAAAIVPAIWKAATGDWLQFLGWLIAEVGFLIASCFRTYRFLARSSAFQTIVDRRNDDERERQKSVEEISPSGRFSARRFERTAGASHSRLYRIGVPR